MKKLMALALLCALLLTGCENVFDGSYSSVTPHPYTPARPEEGELRATNRKELESVMKMLIYSGQEEAVIVVEGYENDQAFGDLRASVGNSLTNDPIVAYAVERIVHEKGQSKGRPALTVQISYRYDASQIKSIQTIADMDAAAQAICETLDRCEVSLVMLIEEFEDVDFLQIVENYAANNPQKVMETPQISVSITPTDGTRRVVDIRFTYLNNRESLKQMQDKVQRVFESAEMYVSGDTSGRQKYAQLCAFLTERFDYQNVTSITPAYSLLCHGVGDCRAFALVYSAMCRQAGLECLTVAGTKDGNSHFWNIICDEGIYYHVDLQEDSFQNRSDREMEDYVWDYSAYPSCGENPELFFENIEIGA